MQGLSVGHSFIFLKVWSAILSHPVVCLWISRELQLLQALRQYLNFREHLMTNAHKCMLLSKGDDVIAFNDSDSLKHLDMF